MPHESDSMTRQDLRIFLDGWFCGCGTPEAAAATLLALLRIHPLYEHQAELHEILPEDGMQYLVLYTLDRYDLTEHGGSVGGGWLTDKGEAAKAGLQREWDLDEFDALFADHCVHGVDLDDQDHDCMAAG